MNEPQKCTWQSCIHGYDALKAYYQVQPERSMHREIGNEMVERKKIISFPPILPMSYCPLKDILIELGDGTKEAYLFCYCL